MSVTGSGTELDPFTIATWDDLMEAQIMMETDGETYPWQCTSWWILTADIDAAGHDFTPIGAWWGGHEYVGFCGHLDGQRHKISHLTINRTCEDEYEYFGLFCYPGDWTDPCWIKNLLLEDINYTIDMNGFSWNDVGGLGGWINAGEYEDIGISGKITIIGPFGENPCVYACGFGGQIGWNHGGRLGGLKRCWTDVDIVLSGNLDPEAYIDLAGMSQWYCQMDAIECFTHGSIDCGGVGYAGAEGFGTVNCPAAEVRDCYTRVTITNIPWEDGWASGWGGNYYTNLARCYAACALPPNNPEWDSVTGFNYGIMDYEEEAYGYHQLGCFWDAELAGTWRMDSPPPKGALPLTTAQMKTEATFHPDIAPWQYEGWLEDADGDSEPIGGIHQSEQSFYTMRGHMVDAIQLLLYRVGHPTTITVEITRQLYDPELDELYWGIMCSGTFDCSGLTDNPDGEVIEVKMDTPGELNMWTDYFVRITGASDIPNHVVWRTSTIAPLLWGYGEYAYSDNGGVDWLPGGETQDALFMLLEYGNWDFETIWDI